ncbi:flagellar assembly protein FliW [uncultured Tyzzerella sp.]|uniref:flagellar assembly protein FliW n=1 Tax=uncultured Tyzzerella sp. TaxID=2321398 RepID=UPI00294317F8|nr:flagellar assembly protein FliW [uncultured Tyzzerella sp.]
MKIKTKIFGEIDINDDKVIYFENGLPGFENLKKFLFMTDEDENSPFCWLQSIEDLDIVFTLFDVFRFLPDYNPIVEIESFDKLDNDTEDSLMVYCIAHIPNDVKNMTINLKAPVVINADNNKANQFICSNEEYPIKYYIYKELLKNHSNESGGE